MKTRMTQQEDHMFRGFFELDPNVYMDKITGFDIMAFGEKIWPEIYDVDGSLSNFITNKYGEEAKNLIVSLIE